MKTKKEITKRAIEDAMKHAFAGYDDEDFPGYDHLVACADSDGDNPPTDMCAWEPFEHMSAKELLEIVDGLAACFESSMIWAQRSLEPLTKYEHELFFNKKYGWYLHANTECKQNGDIVNRQLMVFDKDGNIVNDPRLDDDVWQPEWEPILCLKGIKLEALDGFVTTDTDYKSKLVSAKVLTVIKVK